MALSAGAGWDDARRVLCVRLDTIGDVLMTTPAIRALRRSGRAVTLLTSPAGAEAGALVPEVDEVLVYRAPWMKPPPGGPGDDLAMVEELRGRQFDGAVIFTVYSQSPLPAAMLCHLAGIPRRLAHCRENAYWLLTDRVPEPEPDRIVRHEVRRQLDLVATIGATTDDEALSVVVPEPARSRAAELLDRLGVEEGRPWAVVHPGASAPSRRYPAEHWAEVGRSLARDHGWTLVLTGSPDEVELANTIGEAIGPPARSVAGRLDVAGLAAVLERAPLLVAGNTGPVHVAAAVGTPVVDLYALTNPQHTPWGVAHVVLSHDVPCRYCYASVCPMGHHDCLRRVEPADVVRAAVGLRERAQAAPRPAS
ncbi:MAG TPA: glycosyltransferase family 9 protein [Actinomycetota bacterium]|nr:glycosyltransferase family 9 protein [Actinomycetota bacterium]